MTKNANSLEVFDFKEDDELAELVAEKFLPKLKNPRIEDAPPHADSNYHFFECVGQGSDVARKEISGLPCEHVDAIQCDKGVEYSSFGMVRENFDAAKCGNSDSLTKNSHEHDVWSKVDNSETKISFSEPEVGVSYQKAPSLGKSEFGYPPSDSPSSSELVDVKLDGDGGINKGSPLGLSHVVLEGGAILNGDTSNNDFRKWDMVDMNVVVDYVVYRGNYCPGCVVTFSCNGIKVNGSIACGDLESLSLEKEIDDIVQIESLHIRRSQTVMVKLRILSTDAMQIDDAYGSSGIEELSFVLVEPNWTKKWEEIASLNRKYLALWSDVHNTDATTDEGAHLLQQRSYFPSFEEAFEDVIYPKGDSDAVSISKRDVDLLQPETFINDTIIDFYIKYLKNQIPPEEKHRFHFFNSFFFRKLADLDKDPSSALDGKAAFLRVHKWTRKVDIFRKDYIFIPVNFNLHWSLLVLCHPGEVAGLEDEDGRKPLRVPCILHMDSIKGTHAGLKNLVQSYLWEEWKGRQKETSEELSSKFLNLRFVSLELPQQENSFDCGLFLLHYLELFLMDAPANFSPFRIHESSKFLNLDWFPPAEASLKRTLIQRLISELLENRSQEVSSGDCSDEPEPDFPECSQKVSGVEFVSERCTSPLACQRNLSSSEAGQGIEITLLEASSMRNSQCVDDPGLVLRELFEPGVAGGSLLAQCSSFDQQSSYYHFNGAMPQLEDDAETGEQFAYLQSRDSVFQQIAGVTPQAGSMPYPIRGFGADASWNPGISIQGEEDDSSSESLSCASDDSDVGIIEDCQVEVDAALSQKERIGEPRFLSKGHTGCLTEGLASVEVTKDLAFNDSTAVEGTEDPVGNDSATAGGTEEPAGNEGTDDMHKGTDNGNLACQENGNLTESMPDERYVLEDGLQGDLSTSLHEVPNVLESISAQGLLTSLHEDPKVVVYELPKDMENTLVAMNDTQTTGYDVVVEEEQQAAKRLRNTPSSHEGEGGLSGSLSQDLHL